MAKLKRKGRHSPAGKKWLGSKSVKAKLKEERREGTEPVYFTHIRKPTVETQLRRQGLSEEDLRSLGMGRKKKKR